MARDDITDEQAQRLHAVEQLTGFIQDQAQQAAAYFKALQRQGFDRREAMQLVTVMQTERFRTLYALKPSTPEK